MTGDAVDTAHRGCLQVVVMGVSAAGKTTVARALATSMGASSVEAMVRTTRDWVDAHIS